MAVLSREALEGSPLADLHVLARELGIDGFRRLRKAELVDAIIARQSGEDDGVPPEADDEAPKPKRRSRGGRGRSRAKASDDEDGSDDDVDADAEVGEDVEIEGEASEDERPRRRSRGGRGRKAAEEEGSTDEDAGDDDDEDDDRPRRRSRGGRGGRGRGRDRDRDRDEDTGDDDVEKVAEGTVELLGNGSGFLRVSPPDPSDDDVYISAAQVRRCELVTGDTVTGPVRPPRRSERYPSLVRIDTINGRSADEVAEGTPFDELPAAFPAERFALGSDDATLKAIEWLTPVGRGSRATVVGAPRSGKSEALRRLAVALKDVEGLELSVVLAGVRPEELGAWKETGLEPAAALTLAASPDAQAQAIERVIETAKRIAARGGNAVVLVDTLTHVHPPTARKLLAAARNIVDGGSLTIIATADAAVGGETTVIALDVNLTSTGRFPAVDLVTSGTLRPELLVGDAGADAIAQARAAALG
jgi:transcription termination factor Rho